MKKDWLKNALNVWSYTGTGMATNMLIESINEISRNKKVKKIKR